MLTLTNVSFSYGQKNILDNITYTFQPGTLTCLVGKSGAGKTSLLRLIAQLERNYSGTISYEGNDTARLSPQERSEIIGYVFQQYNLFPHMLVKDNCMQPLKLVRGYTEMQAEKIVIAMLETLDISELADRFPSELSGGQQQRVALARALVMQPKVLCLDEPTAALDPEATGKLLAYLRAIQETGVIIILSTQDSLVIDACKSELLVLDQGRI